MIDVITKKPLSVIPDSRAGPYIRVPATQLKQVEELLSKNGISFWTDENIISFDGRPAVGVINLGRRGDAHHVQAVLDGTDDGGEANAAPE